MKLTIGFSRPTGKKFPIFSWLIRLVEWTPYSHVYLQWYNSYTKTVITYEAGGSSVHFKGKSIFDHSVIVIDEYEISIDQTQRKNLMKYCFEKAGTSYGIKQVIGIGYVKFMGLFGKKKSNPFTDGDKTMVCSELVGNILSEILMKEHNLDLDVAGPKAIHQFLTTLEQQGEITKIK